MLDTVAALLPTLTPAAPPLFAAENGQVLRVAGTHIPLDTVIRAYQSGASAEEIGEGYPTLVLADVYAVLAWYLRNEEAVTAYLAEGDAEAERSRAEHERRFPSDGLRELLRFRSAPRT